MKNSFITWKPASVLDSLAHLNGTTVAQVFNLVYRGFPIRMCPCVARASRLEVGDTAGWKPAPRAVVLARYALGALVLAGLLVSQVARADLMNFDTPLCLNMMSVSAAYQPIAYVHVGYAGATMYNGIWAGGQILNPRDHTTSSYGGTHFLNYQATFAPSAPMVYTFDQPVYIPSVWLSSSKSSPNASVVVRAYANTNGTSLLSSNVVVTGGPTSWTQFTGLTSLQTNIMRLEVVHPAASSGAYLDDLTAYGAAKGTLQGLQLQLPPGTLQPGMITQAVVSARYPSSTNDVSTWATFSSSNTNVLWAAAQGNVVLARGAGTANLIATFGGLSATQAVTVVGPQPVGLPDGYYLVWSDEFNSLTLDNSKWTVQNTPFRDGYQTPRAVSLNGSNLVITCFTENGTNFTGGISSAYKLHPRYGYLEASVQFTDAPGESSGFWLFITTIGFETCGMEPTYFGTEIDICEHRKVDYSHQDISDIVASNLHWDGYDACERTVGVTPYAWGLATGFHTYGLRWDLSQYTLNIDGFKHTCTQGVSHCSEYVCLSSEVGNGSWGGFVPPGGYGSLATSTTKMTVDYVRYYAPTSMVFWDGSASAYWNNAANWTADRAPQAGSDVVFGYLAKANRATTLNQDLTLNSLAFMETADGVSISGMGVLTINGGGIDNISAFNNSTINSRLVVGVAQTWSTSSNYWFYYGPSELIIAGQLAGSANLTLEGYGIVRLSASNTFSGALLVNGGTLKVANTTGSATGSGAVTVAAGGTLTGNGSIGGPVSLSGTLSPGDGVGTLTSRAQSWNGGGLLNWEINHASNSAGHDLVAIQGLLTVQATPASRFTFKLLSLNGTSPGLMAGFDNRSNYTWTVATASGGIAGFDAAAFSVDTSFFSNSLAGGGFTLEVAGNSLVLKFHPATERPQFTGSRFVAAGSVQFWGSGVPAKTYTLQMTTNLPPLAWLTLTNLTADALGRFEFTEAGPTNFPRRFYRLTAP